MPAKRLKNSLPEFDVYNICILYTYLFRFSYGRSAVYRFGNVKVCCVTSRVDYRGACARRPTTVAHRKIGDPPPPLLPVAFHPRIQVAIDRFRMRRSAVVRFHAFLPSRLHVCITVGGCTVLKKKNRHPSRTFPTGSTGVRGGGDRRQ